jgi:hypothetical protein
LAVVKVRALAPPTAPSTAGENDAVTPAGKPLSDSATAEVNPFFGVTIMEVWAVAPAVAFKDEALPARVNVGVGTINGMARV